MNDKSENRNEFKNNPRVLILQSKNERLKDVVAILKPHFSDIHFASKAEDARGQKFDIVFVDYSVTDMTCILAYKKLVEDMTLSLVPSIFIADTKSYDHRLNAFEMGAADFITRPIGDEELLKKTHVHLQNRRRILEDQSVHIGNLSLYPATQIVTVNGQKVSLTQLEYKILHFLLSTPRQVVTRTEIYENVWGPSLSTTGRLDTQLYNLKKKISEFNGKIKSVNKVGMRILTAESTFSQESRKEALPQSAPGPHP